MLNQSINRVKVALESGLWSILSANLLVTVFSFGSQFFVANWLGPVDLGVIKTLQAIFGIAIIFVNFGLTTVLMKEVPLIEQESQRKGLFAYALRFNFWLFLLVFLVLLLLISLDLLTVSKENSWMFLIYFVGLLPLAFNSLSGIYLQAQRLFKKNSRILLIAKSVSIGLVVLLTYLYGLNGFLLGTVAGYFLTSAFYMRLPQISLANNAYKSFNTQANRRNAFYSMLTFLTGKGSLFLDILIIQFFVTDEFQIGLYGFALTLMAGLNIISETLQQYFTPQITGSVNNIVKFQNTLKSKQRSFLIVSVVVGVLAFFCVPVFTEMLFKEYIQAVPLFNVLILSWIFRNAFAMNNTGLVALNRVDLCFKQNILSTIISVMGISIFTAYFGIIGGAIGRSVTSFLSSLLSGIVINRQIRKATDV